MWILDAYVDGATASRRVPVSTGGEALTFGRSRRAGVTLPFDYVSGLHAEMRTDAGRLWLVDLDSANGTFVNTERVVEPVCLKEGDIVQIGANEFIVTSEADDEDTACQTHVIDGSLLPGSTSMAQQSLAFRDLLTNRQVRGVFEPIVELAARPRLVGFELLGRGAHPDLAESPGPLFEVAERLELAAELSVLFRDVGIAQSDGLPGRPRLFVNTHPDELSGDALLAELEALRESGFDLPLTIEIHETAVLNAGNMADLRSAFADLDIGLAYDDFGSGQARLLELVEIPPDYLKFDMSLVRGIDTAPVARVRMLRQLVSMVRDLDLDCIAEGIETRGEYDACIELGFTHGQGYLLGRGQPAEHWARKFAGRLKPRNESAGLRSSNCAA